jgi:hypothetical protein
MRLFRVKKGGQKLPESWSNTGQKVDKGATASQLQIADWKIED